MSTLPIFGKIYERLIFKRVHSFLSAKNIIYENQFGFRKNHSTSHAVNFAVNKVFWELENKNHIIGIFIDLSKAFDTFSDDKLLDKLNNYGIRGKGLQILKSYLQKRTQQTKYNDNISDECLVEYGVPQGSVLGPLLFLIYINDLVNSTRLGQFVLFADDTNIFVVGKDENEVYSKANIVLGKVCEYLYDNQLHINKEKTCFMHFHPRLNSKSRLTFARIRPHGSEFTLNLGDKKVKKSGPC